MKLSYQWLKSLVKFSETPEQLAKLLTMQVAQVDNVLNLKVGLDKVVAVKIVAIKPHPNADKLKVATVLLNSQGEKLEIVCGAPNIAVGQIVPLALVGAKLPNGAEIKESVIRGIKSVGMLCAEDELGLGPDHSGIYILPSSAKIGEPITKVLELNDSILEIENKSMTHRPDLFSVNGFAREIAGIKNLKIRKNSEFQRPKVLEFQRLQKIATTETQKKNETQRVKIKVVEPKLCPRYLAVVMDGVKIGPSPLWMQNRLRNLGIRPINNIVDITNYVLLETGQPLHAFDYNKIADQRGLTRKTDADLRGKSQRQSAIIEVRRAKSNEKLLCLDGVERKLDSSDLVIADSQAPIALAGIIGGEHSAIDQQTKTILIESALFEPAAIRRTSWRSGLRTEAALRFEKGLPINFAEMGLSRAIELIKQLAKGRLASQVYDIQSPAIKKALKTKKIIILSPERLERIVGAKIGLIKILASLKSLGFAIRRANKNLAVTVPQSRPDIEQEEDLIEDIVRIYGSEKIIPQAIIGPIEAVDYEPEFVLEKNIREVLLAGGFYEVYNYSFYGDKLINLLKLKPAGHLSLANPLSPQLKYLRLSLLPYLFENASKNNATFDYFRIFEIGKIYQPQTSADMNADLRGHERGPISENPRPAKRGQRESALIVKEEKYCSGLLVEKNKKIFYAVKGVVETILERVGIETQRISFQAGSNLNYQYLKNLVGIFVDKKLVGLMGEANDSLKNNLKISSPVGVFEINLETLLNINCPPKIFQPISAYPPILRDLSFLVGKQVAVTDLLQTIKNFHPLIISVEPFDLFESDKLGPGVRNLAFHLIFQSFKQTLKSEEVDKLIAGLVKTFEQKFQAKLRNF